MEKKKKGAEGRRKVGDALLLGVGCLTWAAAVVLLVLLLWR